MFTLGFCNDSPGLLAAGGAAGSVTVWDVRASRQVLERWPELAPPGSADAPDEQE